MVKIFQDYVQKSLERVGILNKKPIKISSKSVKMARMSYDPRMISEYDAASWVIKQIKKSCYVKRIISVKHYTMPKGCTSLIYYGILDDEIKYVVVKFKCESK